ncbi:MAG: 6-carboxytetrahydropterin synthase [Alphaproteobacteria bacterium]
MARVEIVKSFGFEAAHRKDAQIYGYSYRVEVALAGEIASNGAVAPFEEIEHAFGPVTSALDHSLLNDVLGHSRPTLENIALWISDRLRMDLPTLSRVSVFRESEGEACHLTFEV